MMTSVVVVDDFLPNPQEVREAALRLEYRTLPFATNFPGRNSSQRLSLDGLEAAISRILGEPMVPAEDTIHCHTRLTLAEDEARGRYRVHVDPFDVWSGILYLTPDALCRGGTEFFRHRRTGSDRAPINEAELARFGFSRFEQIDEDILIPESKDPDAWEHTMTVPMRFNRLLLLRPWLWHTAGPGFGARPEEGRLVLLLFVRPAG